MARTIEEIYNQMLTEKENFSELKKLQPNVGTFQTFLTDLTSNTLMPIWRLIFFVFAVAIHTFEVVLDLWWEGLLEERGTFATGTIDWYMDKILNFQYGYPVVWNGNQFEYTTVDEDAKIVKYVSIVQTGNVVTAKVAKDNAGLPEALTTAEVTALQGYLNEIAFLGVYINVLSLDADLLDLDVTVFVDGMQLRTDGTDINNNKPVKDAINKYLAELDFNGTFRIISLIDAIQAVDGVTNVVIDSCILNTALNNVDVLNALGQQVQSYAGYIKTNNLNINYSL